MSSYYRPQSDGQTERVNRTLEQMLRTYIKSDECEWKRLLPALELAYNTTSHSPTELSPFEVMIGESPLTAADLDIVGALAPTLTPPMTKLLRQLCHRAQSHILKAKWQQKEYADTKRRAVEYALVPHRPRPPALVLSAADAAWPPIHDAAGNPTDEYEVDYIMDQRGSGDAVQYFVKWRGTPEDQATWEPAHHLTGYPALLRAWRRRQRRRLQARNKIGPSEAWTYGSVIFHRLHPSMRSWERCAPHAITTSALEEHRDSKGKNNVFWGRSLQSGKGGSCSAQAIQ
ncbi:hypothetical protein ENH_00031640 [Eimeria necatrix]|uniref:Chromo domain-containing protein n=1 Tax=Eimeria necatrix TaxID=51315 RepID=U6MVQ4_9EIME|nr:hypothetical protein ENH_00031640 [Eimeria necatrix]CDJ67078.1 hypothetical protein ENH_00031640 [Eimeria necatrix]